MAAHSGVVLQRRRFAGRKRSALKGWFISVLTEILAQIERLGTIGPRARGT